MDVEALVEVRACRLGSDLLLERLTALEAALALQAPLKKVLYHPAEMFLGRVEPAQVHLDDLVELGALLDFQACRVNSNLLLLGMPRILWAAFHKVLLELARVDLGCVTLDQEQEQVFHLRHFHENPRSAGLDLLLLGYLGKKVLYLLPKLAAQDQVTVGVPSLVRAGSLAVPVVPVAAGVQVQLA